MATESKSESSDELAYLADEAEKSRIQSLPNMFPSSSSSSSSDSDFSITAEQYAKMPTPKAYKSARSVALSSIMGRAFFYQAEGKTPREAFIKARKDFASETKNQSWYKGLAKDQQKNVLSVIEGKGKYTSGGEQADIPEQASALTDKATPGAVQQTGEYTQPDGKPVKYPELYKKIFQGYSIQAFREHIKQMHPELARLPVPPASSAREKATKVVAGVNGAIRSFGYLLGLKRVKAKTKKGEPNYYDKVFQEREDLRELLFGKIILPHLKGAKPMMPQAPTTKMGTVESSISSAPAPIDPLIRQDQAQPVAPTAKPAMATGAFRVGAIIDVSSLGIDVSALRSVLTGQAPVDGGKAPGRRLPEVSDDSGSLEPSDAGTGGTERAIDLLTPAMTAITTRLRPPIKGAVMSILENNDVSSAMMKLREFSDSQKASNSGLTGENKRVFDRQMGYLNELIESLGTLPATGTPSVPDVAPITPPDEPPPAKPHDEAKPKLLPVKRQFFPSRRRVLEKVRTMTLRPIKPKVITKVGSYEPSVDNVNYYAPDPQPIFSGSLRSVM